MYVEVVVVDVVVTETEAVVVKLNRTICATAAPAITRTDATAMRSSLFAIVFSSRLRTIATDSHGYCPRLRFSSLRNVMPLKTARKTRESLLQRN